MKTGLFAKCILKRIVKLAEKFDNEKAYKKNA